MRRRDWIFGALGSALLLLQFPATVTAADWVYVVADGDNLWNISDKYLHRPTDWTKVQRVNRLKDPNWVRPGTRLRIPLKLIRSNSVPAVVRATQGDVFHFPAAGPQQAATVGGVLQLGDRLETRPEASVSVEFADGTVITLHGDSSAAFDHLSAYGETGMVDSRLRLLQGRVETRVTPASGPGSRFEIHTASAISAVRGTRYRMAVLDQAQTSSIEVTGGTVDASGAQGPGRERIAEGFGTVVAAGSPPLKPRALLPPPQAEPLPERLDRLGWPVAWAELPGAVRYRAELADAESFETVRWERTVEVSRVRLPELPDGTYHLRLRGIDDLGLEGLDTTLVLLQDARPEPPSPLQPADAAVTRETAPTLSWSKSLEAASYRLQVATDGEFKQIISDQAGLAAMEFTEPTTARPGTYHWRLASLAPDGEQGPFGASRRFEVKPMPKSPEPTVSGDDRQLTISWRQGIAGETYQAQLADDRDFTAPTLDRRLDEPNLVIDQVTGKVRYFRVRVVEADGYAGPWAGVQQIEPLPNTTWWKVLGGALLMGLLL